MSPTSPWDPPRPSTRWPSSGEPTENGGGRTSKPLAIAGVAAATSLTIVGFEYFMIEVFSGREESCVAHRGEAYRSCVRSEDVSELVFEALAIGLAAMALAIVVRTMWLGTTRRDGSGALLVAGLAVTSVVVSAVLWVTGSMGGWEPTRPFPYEPLPAVWGHAAMLIGTAVGCLVGVLVPVGRLRSPAWRSNRSEPSG